MTLASALHLSFPTQVNERAARLVAGTVAATLTIALITSQLWLLPVLAVGFWLRVGWGPLFSPLAKAAMWLAPKVWPVKPVFGAPKRFAQGVGAVTLSLAALSWALGALQVAQGLSGVIILFASLEAGLSFCMGCWVYARLQEAGLIAPDACVDCGVSS